MIVEYIRYTIEGARAGRFMEDYAEAARSLDASAYCLSYELSRCVKAPERFILRIEWTSAEDHMEKFRVSPEFSTFLAAIRPYVRDISEMEHYMVTDVARP
jgi:hemoglobin